jgi:hypothetical protein
MKNILLILLSSILSPLLTFADNHEGGENATAETEEIVYDGSLHPDDFVGVSFWLATAMMLAATVFFFIERDRVKGKWKTSLTVAGLVTGIAFLALYVHERSLGKYGYKSYSIQICGLADHSSFADC